MRHSKPGLSCSRGSNPEHEGVAAQRTDVRILRRGTCAHRPLAQVDLLKTCSRVGRIVIKQRSLSDGQADGALEIARDKLATLLEALVQSFEHTPRLLYTIPRTGKSNMVPALLRDHAEPALEQGKILSILSKQRRGQPIVFESEYELRCGATRRYHRGRREGSVFNSRRSQRLQCPLSACLARARRTGCSSPLGGSVPPPLCRSGRVGP